MTDNDAVSARPTPPPAEPPVTLTVDIGGTGIKMVRLDAVGAPLGDRARELTPRPARPPALLAVVAKMLKAQAPFDRVSVGFPGVVVRGVVHTAPNLDEAAWRGTDLGREIATLTQRPVRTLNDADLQGYGVIDGEGVELVLTLGTGLGSALFTGGHLVANLELAHHPFGAGGESYETRISDAACRAVGPEVFTERVVGMIEQLAPILNCDRFFLGGGNARHVARSRVPTTVRFFDNVDGMRGGVALWRDQAPLLAM
ncbi:MAG: ROK family protein [Myxococcota bacterium]